MENAENTDECRKKPEQSTPIYNFDMEIADHHCLLNGLLKNPGQDSRLSRQNSRLRYNSEK